MKTVSVGRSPKNDVIIEDVLVSSQHLLLSRDEVGKFWIEDLNSTNGTWVGKELLRGGRQGLNPETIVKIGDTILIWQNYFLEKEKEKEEDKIPDLPTQIQKSVTSKTHIFFWTVVGISAFLVFLVFFWYIVYVRRP